MAGLLGELGTELLDEFALKVAQRPDKASTYTQASIGLQNTQDQTSIPWQYTNTYSAPFSPTQNTSVPSSRRSATGVLFAAFAQVSYALADVPDIFCSCSMLTFPRICLEDVSKSSRLVGLGFFLNFEAKTVQRRTKASGGVSTEGRGGGRHTHAEDDPCERGRLEATQDGQAVLVVLVRVSSWAHRGVGFLSPSLCEYLHQRAAELAGKTLDDSSSMARLKSGSPMRTGSYSDRLSNPVRVRYVENRFLSPIWGRRRPQSGK